MKKLLVILLLFFPVQSAWGHDFPIRIKCKAKNQKTVEPKFQKGDHVRLKLVGDKHLKTPYNWSKEILEF